MWVEISNCTRGTILSREEGPNSMSPGALHGRQSQDVVFGLFLASGVTVGAYCVWAVADWIHSQGEGAFGLLYLGAFSFVPTLLAWLAGHRVTRGRCSS
jgi:hypothetical protein